MIAKERSDQGDLLIYDLEITDDSGVILERWDGLRLRVVKRDVPRSTWPVPLLGPYLERRMKAMLPGSRLTVEVERNGHADQNARSDRLLRARSADLCRSCGAPMASPSLPETETPRCRRLTPET